MTPVQLPEVPPKKWLARIPRGDECFGYYTAAQLREYATEAVMLNLEMARPFIERVIARSAHAVAGISLPDSMAADWVLEHRKNVETGRALLAAFTPSETNSER